MNLGEWLIWLIWVFFMVIYFMIIFRVLTDVFRRDDLGGWAKAGWILLLLFLPLLTLLIYVIGQGPKMAQRDMSQYAELRSQQDAYIRDVAGSGNATEQIKSAHDLLQSGAITQAEFDALKAKALS